MGWLAAGSPEACAQDPALSTESVAPEASEKSVPPAPISGGQGRRRAENGDRNGSRGVPSSHLRAASSRLPRHVRNDTGKVAGTLGLHGDMRIDEPPTSPAPEEIAVIPIPARRLEEAGIRLLRRMHVRVWHGLEHLAYAGRGGAGSHAEEPSAGSLASSPSKTSVLAAGAGSPPGDALTAPAHALAPRPSGPERASGVMTLEVDVLDRIRLEIKSRLPYFQACADAARRRGVPDVRRLQATWIIADNGSIKLLKVEGTTDAQLTTCITRMGSRPFPVSPGTELTIPTPIVFVR